MLPHQSNLKRAFFAEAGADWPATAVAAEAADAPEAGKKLIRERAFGVVRDAIVAGRLRPGTRLVERELCETLGISRTVAREVIRRLEGERLVDVTAHRGPRVATLTPKLVEDIYEMRMELEVLFIRAFIRCASDEEMARLWGFLDDFKAAAAARDKYALVDHVTRFLHYLIAVSGKQVAGEIFDHLLARINMLRIMAMGMSGQIENSIVEISAIIERTVARDADGAEAAVRRYVAGAGRAALTQLDAGAPGPDAP